MDAEYLKSAVHESLVEALSAAALAGEENGKNKNKINYIDHIGNYLLQIVKRKNDIIDCETDLLTSIIVAKEEEEKEKHKQSLIDLRIKDDLKKKRTFDDFKNNITSCSTKDEVMNELCDFAKNYLNVPAVYIASKTIVNDLEFLSYVGANKSQKSTVIGKQISKSLVDDEEESENERKGLSFQVFKIPEAENDENEAEGDGENDENDENEESPAKSKVKTPPKLTPLVIENVMRNNKIKFFGIPKLGSLVVVPLQYQSTDIISGCQIVVDSFNEDENNENNDDDENEEKKNSKTKSDQTKYIPNFELKEYILAADTIGEYRVLKAEEVNILEDLGNILTSQFERVEKNQFADHTKYLVSSMAFQPLIEDLIQTTKNSENEEIEAVELEFNPITDSENNEGNEDGENEENGEGNNKDEEEKAPPHELLKPYKLADRVEKVWRNLLTSNLFQPPSGVLLSLTNYKLPPPVLLSSLFKAIAFILNLPDDYHTDIFGNTSWDVMKEKLLPNLAQSLSNYQIDGVVSVTKEKSFESIKSFCESENLMSFDSFEEAIPQNIVHLIRPLHIWLLKVLSAREAAINYFIEAEEKVIENVIDKMF